MKTLSYAAFFCAVLFCSSCATNVPPPDDVNAVEWAPGIQMSYPGWQPPSEMPEGNPEYELALLTGEFPDPLAKGPGYSDDDMFETEVVPKTPVLKTPGVVSGTQNADQNVLPVASVQKAPAKHDGEGNAAAGVTPSVSAETVPDERPGSRESELPANFMRVDIFDPSLEGVSIYAVNGNPVEETELKDLLMKGKKENRDIAVIVFCRANYAYSDLETLLAGCKEAGLEKINVITQADILEMQKKQVQANRAKSASSAGAGTRMKLVEDPLQLSREYVVKDGDSLSAIAKKLYHDGTAWEIIFEANRTVLNGDANRLKPGMKLLVPAVKKVPVSSK